MKKAALVVLAMYFGCTLSAQNNTFPASGNAGAGTTTPQYRFEVVAPPSYGPAIGVSNVNYSFNPSHYAGGLMNPLIGFPDFGAGLTYFNDGMVKTLGMTIHNRLLWNGLTTAEHRIFRINGGENNQPNFTLELRNNGTYSASGSDWISKPNTSVITAYNKSLHIGTGGDFPVKVFTKLSSPNTLADLFIFDRRVGVGTEAPNENSKLHVNGNIYSSGKVFIGVPDANTATKIAPYALAVDGAAIFTKAVVKLKTNWPDYVFYPNYKVPALQEIEAFIRENGHLPEMPKAADVAKNGIDLGENQALLLKKIEELTLILIEMEKKIEFLEKEIK